MDELLNKIFQSELLTEDNKKEIKEAFAQALEEAKAEARAQAETQAKAEIAEQFVADKEALVEAIDTKLDEIIEREMTEIKEDAMRFRNLEVEMAEKLVEARQELAGLVKKDMAELVEALDQFLEVRLTEEVAELKEDIEAQKKLQFGQKIFESFAKEFKTKFLNEDETTLALAEAQAQLATAQSKLDEATKEMKAVKREKEMTKVLESLTGRPKEVMEVILKTVSTDKLQETYNNFIHKVLHENAVEKVEGDKSEKESDSSSVLAEGNTSKEEKTEPKVTLVTGDNVEALKEEKKANEDKNTLSESARKQLKRLAGIE
jgi:hypothetical protein